MPIKLKNSFLIPCLLILLSCNSGEKTNDNKLRQETENDTETKIPSDDLTSLENELLHDSLNIDLRTTIAAKYYSAGKLKKAEDHFLNILKLDSANLIALSNLGNIYYDGQENEKAIQFYLKALKIEPGNIDMRCDLATCYSRMNKYKQAIRMLRENIKTDFKHKQSHYNLSVILQQSGKKGEAAEEMKIFQALTAESR